MPVSGSVFPTCGDEGTLNELQRLWLEMSDRQISLVIVSQLSGEVNLFKLSYL